MWGTLPNMPVSILNGLGSSGVLKGPYYAHKLIESLTNSCFDKEDTHIDRFL